MIVTILIIKVRVIVNLHNFKIFFLIFQKENIFFLNKRKSHLRQAVWGPRGAPYSVLGNPHPRLGTVFIAPSKFLLPLIDKKETSSSIR